MSNGSGADLPFSMVKHMGGVKRRTLLSRPVTDTSTWTWLMDTSLQLQLPGV